MDSLVIVDYGAGNLTSVANAVRHLGESAVVSSDPKVVAAAGKLIFPGVGAAMAAMQTLEKSGLGSAITEVVGRGNPVLGICIGSQIILDESDEDGGTKTLGLIPGKAVRFKDEPGLKIPHIGWNQVNFLVRHPIFEGIPDGADFYFVHSYHPSVASEFAVTRTTYGTQTFTSCVSKGNLIATQFHLEKSGDYGLHVLKNFCKL